MGLTLRKVLNFHCIRVLSIGKDSGILRKWGSSTDRHETDDGEDSSRREMHPGLIWKLITFLNEVEEKTRWLTVVRMDI